MNMVLILHICIATGSLLCTGATLIFPSKLKLAISYALVAATVATGIGLLLGRPAHMAQVCMTGLTYLAVVMAGIFGARYRLAKIERSASI